MIVNLPPEIVERLNPVESFPSPAWATIIAAGIAVTAALIAFIGVMMQIRATEREHERQRSADLARQRRAERGVILTRAASEANEMWDAYTLRDLEPGRADKKLEKAFNAATLTVELLRLADLPGSAAALSKLIDAILAAWKDPTKTVPRMETLIESFKSEINAL